MIFPSINALFIHIPKCAGMNILNNFVSNNIFFEKECCHKRMSSFEQHQVDDLFKFTFIRNPWDRIASHYFFNGPGAPQWPELLFTLHNKNRYYEIKRQYRYPSGFQDIKFDEYIKNYVCNDSISPNPQNFGVSKSILYNLKNKQDKVDFNFIGRVENFETDFRILLQKLNLDLKIQEEVNCHPRKIVYNNLYNSYLYDVVKDYFKEEIDYFGFEYNINEK